MLLVALVSGEGHPIIRQNVTPAIGVLGIIVELSPIFKQLRGYFFPRDIAEHIETDRHTLATVAGGLDFVFNFTV